MALVPQPSGLAYTLLGKSQLPDCEVAVTLSPCQGRLPRRKYINMCPSASRSSLRLCSAWGRESQYSHPQSGIPSSCLTEARPSSPLPAAGEVCKNPHVKIKPGGSSKDHQQGEPPSVPSSVGAWQEMAVVFSGEARRRFLALEQFLSICRASPWELAALSSTLSARVWPLTRGTAHSSGRQSLALQSDGADSQQDSHSLGSCTHQGGLERGQGCAVYMGGVLCSCNCLVMLVSAGMYCLRHSTGNLSMRYTSQTQDDSMHLA